MSKQRLLAMGLVLLAIPITVMSVRGRSESPPAPVAEAPPQSESPSRALALLEPVTEAPLEGLVPSASADPTDAGPKARQEEGRIGVKENAQLVGERGEAYGSGGLAVRGVGSAGGQPGASASAPGGRVSYGSGGGNVGYGRATGSGYGASGGVVGGAGVVTTGFGSKGERPVTPDGYGDNYSLLGENDFQSVADTPLSTFSIDVDTASYANVRRYLQEGVNPPRDAVRIEELINYFDYDYAGPTDAESPFATHVEVTACPWATGHTLARIGIQGRELPDNATPPRNLVFLVDVSGSMSGADRLPLAQRGLLLLADQLGPKDRVSLVVYAGAAGVVLEPTPGNERATIREAIGRLRSGGSTAGAEGIRLAYALARKHFDDHGINRVILATDGDFNVGVQNESELTQLIEEERRHGVFLTVLGFGRGNLQDAKMEALADKGNGNFAYIDGMDELRKVLGTEVGATLVTIAKDVKIQVEFNPALVSRYRLIGYENRLLAARDFNDDTKDAGEIGAGHAVTALYELEPASAGSNPEVDPLKYQVARTPSAAATEPELMTVKIRYKAPTGDVSKLLSSVVPARVRAFAQASRDTRWAATVAGFGMLLRDSPHLGTLTWSNLLDQARESVGRDDAGRRAQMVDLIGRARDLRPG